MLLSHDIYLLFAFSFQKSIEEFGCKAPYGLNSDNICTDPDKSNEAMRFYNEQYSDRFHIKECPYPCKSTKINMGSKSNNENPIMNFEFNKFIKTTKARYNYRELEFIAEFGGYVGLFLGISVLDINWISSKILDHIRPH